MRGVIGRLVNVWLAGAGPLDTRAGAGGVRVRQAAAMREVRRGFRGCDEGAGVVARFMVVDGGVGCSIAAAPEGRPTR